MHPQSDIEPATVTVASLNFIDLRLNSGPAVNETEFNRWLLRAEPNAILYSPHCTGRLGANVQSRIVAFGEYSLRSPVNGILVQLELARALARALAPGGILYYRHSRLAFAIHLLRKRRPDIKIAMTRTHPSGSDTAISKPMIKRLFSSIIEKIDIRLRVHIARTVQWIDCVTPLQAVQLRAETGRSVEVVMNGVNTEVFIPLSKDQRAEVRCELDIPEGAIVVGYCGGFPEQRGAREITNLVRAEQNVYGIIVGKLPEDTLASFSHERMRLLGEISYEQVARLVGVFDVAVAFDLEGRSNVVGNSNQKVRQGLACGAWILTQGADLPFQERPVLGTNVEARDPITLGRVLRHAKPLLQRRSERVEFAREYLDTKTIFENRHHAIIEGARS